MEKTSNLYSFNRKYKFSATEEKNAFFNKEFALSTFVEFAEDNEESLLGYIHLSGFLQNWYPTSKCSRITLAQESLEIIGFYLNGLDCKGKKAHENEKRLAIESFYKSLFPKEIDAEGIKFSVSTHTTLFIEVNNCTSKDTGDIIAAVTFLYDKTRENAMILSLIHI